MALMEPERGESHLTTARDTRRDLTPMTLTKLRWSPAAATYVDKHVNAATTSVSMSTGVDYRIIFDEPVAHRVIFSGGRHVKMVGWEFNIPLPASTAAGTVSSFLSQCAAEFRGQTGVVFLEGGKVGGKGALDSIRVSGSPLATFIIQATRLECDRIQSVTDASDGLFHTDGFQCWSGLTNLRMGQVTIRNPYQGGMFGDGALQKPWGSSIFDRVNFRPPATVGQQRRIVNFVTRGSPVARPDGPFTFQDGTVFYEIDTAKYKWASGSAFYTNVATGTDSKGRQYGEPNQANIAKGINNGAGGKGRIYRGPPPDGDFCPATVPGIGYVSPGYA